MIIQDDAVVSMITTI